MLRTFAQSLLTGAVQKGTGVTPAGPVSTALLTTGASLLLSRGRRPVGLALIAAGGLVLWREVERDRFNRASRAAGRAAAKAPR